MGGIMDGMDVQSGLWFEDNLLDLSWRKNATPGGSGVPVDRVLRPCCEHACVTYDCFLNPIAHRQICLGRWQPLQVSDLFAKLGI